MSVLIEHQVSSPCSGGKHQWNPTQYIADAQGHSTGSFKQCYKCGSVVEFRLNGEYPND